jgi:hypothetical protein
MMHETYLHCLNGVYLIVWDDDQIALVVCERMVTVADI